MTTQHDHLWRTFHLDACHWYADEYACRCGKMRTTRRERGPIGNPGDLEWLDGECPQCRVSLSGAVPADREWIYDAGDWSEAILGAVMRS